MGLLYFVLYREREIDFLALIFFVCVCSQYAFVSLVGEMFSLAYRIILPVLNK